MPTRQIKAKIMAGGALCVLALNAVAGSMGTVETETYRPWSAIASLGYTWFNNAYQGGPTAGSSAQSAIGDGQTALGRFAIARDLGNFKAVHFGLEAGIQNGNIMRPSIPEATLGIVGGLPPQLNIKPMLDLLATESIQPFEGAPLFGIVKAGIAYRRLQINDRITFNDLSQISFEVQAGVGMQISDRANLSLNYQGVINGNTTYTINSTAFTGYISNIPSQNGVLLSLSYAI